MCVSLCEIVHVCDCLLCVRLYMFVFVYVCKCFFVLVCVYVRVVSVCVRMCACSSRCLCVFGFCVCVLVCVLVYVYIYVCVRHVERKIVEIFFRVLFRKVCKTRYSPKRKALNSRPSRILTLTSRKIAKN